MRRYGWSPLATLFALLILAAAPLGAHAGSLQTETNYIPLLVVVPASISLEAEPGQTVPDQTVQVSADAGPGIAYTVSGTANWMDVAPPSGTAFSIAGSAHTVSFDETKFTAETTYSAVVRVVSAEASNSPVSVPVSVRIATALRLYSPAGGETWTQGRMYQIRWGVRTAAAGPTQFQVLKGATLVYSETATHTGAGDFAVNFKVPYTFTPGTDYKIRISGAGGRTVISGPISVKLPPIKIEMPNGGETWQITKPAQIKWKINDTAKVGTWLDFYLYRYNPLAGAFPFTKVADLGASGAPEAQGTYNLENVPDVGKGGGNQFVIVAAKFGQSMASPAGLDPDLLDVSDDVFTITDPPIRVIAPNVDTVRWTVLEPATIHWRANSPNAKVGLELWDEFGKKADLITTPDSSPNSENTKTITVPLLPAGEYRVRAFRTDNPTAGWEDFSDEPLILINPDIKVVSPNGGETLFVNTYVTIEWLINIKRTGSHATLTLWKGDTEILTLRSLACTEGLNQLTLLLPNVTPGADYRVKVAGDYDPTWNDFSNTFFRIDPKPIKVISPNGGPGVLYFHGGTMPVHFTNVPSQAGTEFYVELYMLDYMMFRMPDVYVSNGDLSFNLTVPDWVWPGTFYQLKVISKSRPDLYDSSDYLFTIGTPPIHLYTPWGGQTYLHGQTMHTEWGINAQITGGTQIKYQIVNAATGAKIDMKGTGGQAVFYPNYTYGSSDLAVPSTIPAGQYYVRIISNNNPAYYDDSDGVVTIKPPAVQVVAPNGGGWTQAGTLLNIHWKTYVPDAGPSVNLQLWRKSGGLIANLGTDSYSTGDHTKAVKLPTTLAWRDDYFIRVISTANANMYDDSDGVFTIRSVPQAPGDLKASAGASAIYLNWVPSPDDTVSGYDVYRSTSSAGTFTKINPYLVLQPYYTDATVSRGVKYYYYVKAVSRYSSPTAPVVSSPSNMVNAIVGQVKLVMQDVHRGVSGEFMVHVYCPNLTGVLGNRLNLVVKYPSIVTFVRVEKTILTNNFSYTVTNASGLVTVAGASLPNLPLSGSGRLFDLVFRVNTTAAAYQTAQFSFSTNTRLYTMNAAGTQIQLTPDLSDTATLTVDNRYRMGDVDGNGLVNTADVDFAMSRVAAGVNSLQLLAGDVDGDGAFSLFDIQLIMLLSQGKSINPVQTAKIARKTELAPLNATTFNITLGVRDAINGENIALPLSVNPGAGIAGFLMQVNYDPGVLQMTGVSTTSLTANFLVSQPSGAAGAKSFGMVSTTGLAGAGQVALLKFKVIGTAGSDTTVQIASCQMSDAFGTNITNGGNTINLTGAQGVVNVTTPPNAVRSNWALYR